MYILENWRVVFDKNLEREFVVRIRGDAYGNPSFRPGNSIYTSTICGYRVEGVTLVVITNTGSEYLLGKPADAKPFALRRLIRHLQDVKLIPPQAPPQDLSATNAIPELASSVLPAIL